MTLIHPPKPVFVAGVQYESMAAAAKANGVTRAAISKVLRRKGEEALATYKFQKGTRSIRKVVIYKGVEYRSIRAWGRAMGFKYPAQAQEYVYTMEGVVVKEHGKVGRST